METNITLDNLKNYCKNKAKQLEKAEQKRLKRDDNEVLKSCEQRSEEYTNSFTDIWGENTKYLHTNTKNIPYDKELTFNQEFKEKLSKKLYQERQKEKNPRESKREQKLKEAIYNKICSKNKAPIIVTKI